MWQTTRRKFKYTKMYILYTPLLYYRNIIWVRIKNDTLGDMGNLQIKVLFDITFFFFVVWIRSESFTKWIRFDWISFSTMWLYVLLEDLTKIVLRIEFFMDIWKDIIVIEMHSKDICTNKELRKWFSAHQQKKHELYRKM